ncbi:inositol monophosphatase family protein [Nocardia sp. XZ_19_369]|uniref:inositol monophosphatase family protein n=1 Tax=Nocardia sp. XZ_19_369 TaxID=2769487 RepID=UPI00188DE44C|nr:inositol monophosphatase family protein [Nocardia sp. XZ_19_369]
MDQQVILALMQAGAVARGFEGKVANDGKVDDTAMPHDTPELRERRAAKTTVDVVVQDVLLIAAAAYWGSGLSLDAEEESSMRRLFRRSDSATLVIDPIDGTMEYLLGRDSYSICLGLASRGRFGPVYIYFPRRDQLYWTSEQDEALMAAGASIKSPLEVTHIKPQLSDSNIVYVNGRVPVEAQNELRDLGLTIVDDTENDRGAPNCLIDCINGRALCYVSHTRQMRDIMLGAVIAAIPQGYALNWEGKALEWPNGGRVPRAVFGVGHLSSKIWSILKKY